MTAEITAGARRLVTPVAAQILPPGMDNLALWHDTRQCGLGGSDAAVVLGISPWDSRFALYYRKRGELPEKQVDNWGHRLEPLLADWYADQHPGLEVYPVGTLAHVERPWQLANPDRLVWGSCVCGHHRPGREPVLYRGLGAERLADPWHVPCCDAEDCGPCCERCPTCPTINRPPIFGLEIKTGSRYEEGWGEPGTDDIPVYYRAQVMHYMDVTGLPEWHLAVLLDGRDPVEYVVRYDRTDAELIRAAEAEFWYRVQGGVEPELDGSYATWFALRHLFGGQLREPAAVIPKTLARRYRAAGRREKAAGAAKREAAIQILYRMGPSRRAITRDGTQVATRTSNGQLRPARDRGDDT